MKETTVTVERFAPRHAFANRLLRVDLSNHRITVEPTDAYLPDYIGGRGLAARIAWNEYPEPVDPFAPENPLMLIPGGLTGTRSSYSGRTAVCSFSPQAYPYNWFTRANIGHQWGAELKKAGYDGIIVTGASDTPAQIIIRDDEVRIAPADHLWGLDTFDAQEAVRKDLGTNDVRTVTIGPAGERLSRIATIHTATSSVAGQSGFGAVMGSKKLKAISVIGTGQPSIACLDEFNQLVRAVGDEVRSYKGGHDLKPLNDRLQAECGGRARPYACTASCPTPCNTYYSNMPGVAYPDQRWEGHMACVGSCFRGFPEGGPISHGGLYDWQLGLYGGMEMNVLSNRYGLNQWDLVISMAPWLVRCSWDGLFKELNGVSVNWQDAKFWATLLHAIAYREGEIGDALAEGGLRAANILGMGQEYASRYYTAWGYGGHWDGHGCWLNHLVFPYWLVSALQWSTDTRDPYSSAHCYVQNIMRWSPFGGRKPEHVVSWENLRGIGQRLYGSPDATDPQSGYKDKAYPAFYHDRRSVIKDSTPTDDQTFTLIYTVNTEDRFCRIGDIDGPAVDYHLFRLATGAEWSEADFDRAADRIYTLERAINVRHWARDRKIDETALPAFEYEENWVNPLVGEKQALDRQQFKPVMDEYYRHLGWDVKTGWPTRERLNELGLKDVYAPMVAGAIHAREKRPAWPKRAPVKL